MNAVSAAEYLRDWRARHPHYNRDYMRRHLTNPAKGKIWGGEYVPARTPLPLVLMEDRRCNLCGLRRPDRLFVCAVEGCPQKMGEMT